MEPKSSPKEVEIANTKAAIRDDPVQMYLNDIGAIDLLEQNQEFCWECVYSPLAECAALGVSIPSRAKEKILP